MEDASIKADESVTFDSSSIIFMSDMYSSWEPCFKFCYSFCYDPESFWLF
jgi:hypothetical protein